MSAGGERTVHIVRYLAIAALAAINIVLIGLNLQKHEIFPFGPETENDSGLVEKSDEGESALSDEVSPGSELSSAGNALSTSDESAADDSAATDAETDSAVPDSDWPGGQTETPTGPPIPRVATLNPDGTVELTGSVPSWDLATRIADNIGRRLDGGQSAVAVRYTWHPEASDGEGDGALELAPAVLYLAGEVAVPADHAADLDLIAEILQSNPDVFLTVVAHTDDLGDGAENSAVAVARTTGIVDYLESLGVGEARVVTVVAPTDPDAPPNDDQESRAFNRRVELRLENVLTSPLTG